MRSVSKVEPVDSDMAIAVSAPAPRERALWVTWNGHRRTSGLCAAWDLPLHVIRSATQGPLGWVERALRTLGLLWRIRPEILVVQNPSLALTALAALSRRAFGYYLVVDAHNEGVRPFIRRGRLVHRLTRRLLGHADATIVTNAALAKDVAAAGGRPLVLPDRLPEPELPAKSPADDGAAPRVTVISSFMVDEPVAAILTAAAELQEVRFDFTGDARRLRHHNGLPANVRLTGYLTDRAFWKLLSQSTVICDLTLKPDCLVCGAYEALAVAKPMVLSDNPATRRIFGPAAVLTDNTPSSIASAIRAAIAQRGRLGGNARALRAGYVGPWRMEAVATWDAICAGAAARRVA